MSGHFDPDQPRDPEGKWTSGPGLSGLPSVLSSVDLSLGGKSGRIESKPGGKVTFGLGGAEVELDREPGAIELAKALGKPKGEHEIVGADGHPALRLRPGNGDEVEVDVLGKDATTVTLNRTEREKLATDVDRAAAAQRLEVASGPVDVYLSPGGDLGVRTKVGDQDARALEFDAKSWLKLRDAEDVLTEGYDEFGDYTDAPYTEVDRLTIPTNQGSILLEKTSPGANGNIRWSQVGSDDWSLEHGASHADPFNKGLKYIEYESEAGAAFNPKNLEWYRSRAGAMFGRAQKGRNMRTAPRRIYRATGHIDRSALADDQPLRVIMASEGRMADGIDLRMAGANLARYRGNPVLGYGHTYGGRENLPIGRVNPDSLRVEGKHLVGDLDFDQDDPFALKVERKMRAGYLNAVSIGFEVTEWENGQGDYWRGGVASGWEPAELSVVPVPMDATALVTSGRSLDDAEMAELLRRFEAALRSGRGPMWLGTDPEIRPRETKDVPGPPAQEINQDAARSLLAAFAPKEIG
ncbi:hypothetical protein HH310_12535 [Actinoplanes sp. TBRC 11911]|uniref:HK97 family phage prohead protease n=1 Tax=Actinoplanes sp. TBRC 11911 TaxID=2729386 RepID=UPI00145FC457|nr:HK97 family phage prohead protease [Actinoplanes sp. TBRC 11911]NMO52020.1 hypothetical protein [Actinoplanes sp. TBRC 11911]